jgi:DNA-binding NarL/FixJ family response regulator
MIRVFIADDHAIVRHGIRQLITSTSDMVVVGEAADGWEVLRAAEQAEWDLVVLDLSLPRLSGIEVLRRLHAAKPELLIIVLSMYPEDQFAARLRDEGAAAYLSKHRSPEELLASIRAIASGGAEAGASSASAEHSVPLPHETLTARELQVFTLLIQGCTPSEICAELNLTSGTVSTHVHKIKEKLHAPSIAMIVRYAHRMGLIE